MRPHMRWLSFGIIRPVMTVIPIPAFEDNDIWLVHDASRALVVDPGDAEPVLACLAERGLTLKSILVTHHHRDHTAGVAELAAHSGAQVYFPADEPAPCAGTPVRDGDVLRLALPDGSPLHVLGVAGHTRGHVAYWAQPSGQDPLLFCGDTLFSAGCGRLFEGSPAQMTHALQRLAALPESTRVCCAHEYTASGLRFAAAVEPDNADVRDHQVRVAALRAQGLPSLPSTIALERRINPFLRLQAPAVIAAAQAHAQPASGWPQADDPVAVFAALRAWKDRF